MSQKKTNDILEEQRRAREEFLKLKRMQQGEIPTGPKPSEEAILPKTPKEKFQNFWFHNKWTVIGLTALVLIVTFLTVQAINKPKYDYQVIYFSYSQAMDDQLETVEEYFENLSSDVDGNGEVNVQVINCSFYNEQQNASYRNTILTKLQAIVAAEPQAMLFVTDQDSFEYFDNMSDKTKLFEGEPILLDEEFYKKTKHDTFGNLPEGLQVSVRRIKDTTLQKNEKAKPVYEEALRVLEKLK